jgi:hypothetical protein
VENFFVRVQNRHNAWNRTALDASRGRKLASPRARRRVRESAKNPDAIGIFDVSRKSARSERVARQAARCAMPSCIA